MNKFERLKQDLTTTGHGKMKAFGNSMLPILKSGSTLTFERATNYEIGDIVFCKVKGRYIDAHKIIKKDTHKGYLIANNHGFENGWTRSVYARVIAGEYQQKIIYKRTQPMEAFIQEKLLNIEREQRINILFACESGSRGWGLPSIDSDYDVRFIFTRTTEEYLSVKQQEETIQLPINELLDIQGWDLRKALKLICKSNTTPFEWLQSPIVYKEICSFRKSLWSLCAAYYSQRGNTHHYLGIARGTSDLFYAEGSISIKKLFYILRPLLAAKWCLEKNTIAPMTFDSLAILLPEDLHKEISNLIRLKKTVNETYMIQLSTNLQAYIDAEYQEISVASRNLTRTSFSPAILDKFFLKTINGYDYPGT